MVNTKSRHYILCSWRWRSSTQSAKTRLGADCDYVTITLYNSGPFHHPLRADWGSDHEILIVKFRLKLKKVGKTTRPFRYDLNQIPYNSTVKMTHRLKGLDLMECLKNYGWRFMTLYRRQGSRPSPRKRNAKRQNGSLRRPYKELWIQEKKKRKDIPTECRVPKNCKER